MSAPASHVRFHAHLDECERCRNQPFNLCATGTKLLQATADHDALAAVKKAYGVKP